MTYAERTKALESCRPGHCAPATDRRPRSQTRAPSPSHSQSSGPLLDLDNAASPVPSTIWCQLLHAEFFCCHSTVPSRHRSFFTPTSGPSRPHANVLCFPAMRWYGKVWMGWDGMGALPWIVARFLWLMKIGIQRATCVKPSLLLIGAGLNATNCVKGSSCAR